MWALGPGGRGGLGRYGHRSSGSERPRRSGDALGKRRPRASAEVWIDEDELWAQRLLGHAYGFSLIGAFPRRVEWW